MKNIYKKKLLTILIILVLLFSTFIVSLDVSEEKVKKIEKSTVDGSSECLPWPMVDQNPLHTRRSPYDTSYIEGSLKWMHNTSSKNSKIMSDMFVGENGLVYIRRSSGKNESVLTIVNESDGSIYEEYTLDHKNIKLLGLDKDTIYTGSGNTIYALNEDGTERWSKTLFGNITDNIVIDSESIYVGAFNLGKGENKLYCLNKQGEIKWTFNNYSRPAIDDGTIYVDGINTIYALNKQGEEKWNVSLEEDLEMITFVSIGPSNTVYTGGFYGDESSIIALDQNGDKKWSKYFDSYIARGPAITENGTIYLTVGSDKSIDEPPSLYRISPNGKTRWTFKIDKKLPWNLQRNMASSPVVGKNGIVYLTAQRLAMQSTFDKKILFSISPDGTQKWNYTYEDSGMLTSPVIGEYGTIYTRVNKTIYAIGEDPYPSEIMELDIQMEPDKVELSWGSPEDEGMGGIQKYNIYRGTSEENLTLLDTVTSDDYTDINYTDVNVEEGEEYFYCVSAVNEAGEGPKSLVVGETVPVEEDPDQVPGFTMIILIICLVIVGINRNRKR